MTIGPVIRTILVLACGVLLGIMPLNAALADGGASDAVPETWSLHAQTTFVEQYHPRFRSPYRGANSLDPGSRGNESIDLTIFAGLRLWSCGEAYVDPEVDQGFGLSNTLGVAGFPSGETGKVGAAAPYFRLQRIFFRQTFNLGGGPVTVEADANQLAGAHSADNVVVTAGKFDVTDIFDTNAYAHDTKNDFLNWAVIDAGAFDYAADSWGYSYGIATEWTQSWWTLRGGVFDLSKIPNLEHLETGFAQFEVVGEFEERHKLWGEDGKLKVLAFINRGRMGDYNDAVELGALTHTTPDTALVRNYASRPGFLLNLEQSITDSLGSFVRASVNDGSKEAYEYTEINRSVSAGLSLSGAAWGRGSDTVGAAGAVNAISASARRYFAAGGLGILIGDGRLPHYGTENILELYYKAQIAGWLTATADYQYIDNPAYNRDRGPVSVIGARLHAQI
jgi:high affinity Mn2+ porin